MNEKKKAAFVALIGRPSVGKSTLLNTLCKAKVSIVSRTPQTTRNAIRGIVNGRYGQLVFIDTPGMHQSEKKFNKKLQEVSIRSRDDADLILYVLDSCREPGPEEEAIVSYLASQPAESIVVAVNKNDDPDSQPDRAVNFVKEHLSVPDTRCFSLSALERVGTEPLLDCLFECAPEGDAFYPEEYYTDQEVPFRIAEIIREKATRHLYDELPHSIYVEVADAELRNDDTKLWVRAFLVTERESQKGIVVGKGASMIKVIRQEAERDLNRIFEWKVELDLRVKTVKDWRHRDASLHKLIW
ncbi:GTPase Era [Spirochaetia bacterium]|nr:GTPase Era [Spirochaetia bacterium]